MTKEQTELMGKMWNLSNEMYNLMEDASPAGGFQSSESENCARQSFA